MTISTEAQLGYLWESLGVPEADSQLKCYINGIMQWMTIVAETDRQEESIPRIWAVQDLNTPFNLNLADPGHIYITWDRESSGTPSVYNITLPKEAGYPDLTYQQLVDLNRQELAYDQTELIVEATLASFSSEFMTAYIQKYFRGDTSIIELVDQFMSIAKMFKGEDVDPDFREHVIDTLRMGASLGFGTTQI